MISRLLVANRGEIARRVFRCCRRAGISTVAVFSDPDAAAPYVAEADRAISLPGAAAAQTYLHGAALVAAALAAGADAVHPGYGFLAEDPEFARQVLAAGLTWVGPPPEAMEAMARKITARSIAASAGLPVLGELDPAAVTAFPVLVKASSGGGGRGMRAVSEPDQLPSAIESARREAEAAFGDGTVFCEPLLTGARHVEVQVLADQAGTVWTMTERDCSVQRRYAKVIEESPSPAVGQPLRDRLHAAAAALAAAVGYQGAGTVEFLLAPSGEFYFLEFNTRLQVEHPVTELVHGIDLVACQLQIAEGTHLAHLPPPASGHAIEARLYAEDPAAGFRPAAGRVHEFTVPGVNARFGLPDGHRGPPADGAGRADPVLRLDSGVVPGTVISPHYDAMLAKFIAWAPNRAAAVRRLTAGLTGARIAGPATNRDLLVSVLRDPAFQAGTADTALLDGYDLAATGPSDKAVRLSAAAAAAACAAANRESARAAGTIAGGWRNLVSQPQLTSFDTGHGRVDVRYHWSRTPAGVRRDVPAWRAGITIAGITVSGSGDPRSGQPGSAMLRTVEFGPDRVVMDDDGVQMAFDVSRADGAVWVHSPLGAVRLALIERLPAPGRAADRGSLHAPMPGAVIDVKVTQGDQLTAGQLICVLEAMKMEHRITAPAAGSLTELRVAKGSQVRAGDLLAVIATDEPEANQEAP